MAITHEVQSGMEVFAVDVGRTEDVCGKCVFSPKGVDAWTLCSSANCKHLTRPDGREVYFLPVTDLKGQLLFHTQTPDDGA